MRTILVALLLCILAFYGNAQTPISNVQGQQDLSPLVNQTVTVAGIVTAVSKGNGYFIQDGDSAWCGVYIYDPARNPMPVEGDSVMVTGTVAEYYYMTEIKSLTFFEIIASGKSIPKPIRIKTGDFKEPYEGMLIEVENANCSNPNMGYGEWEVNDESGAVVINDFCFPFSPSLNVVYNVTGVLDYSFDVFKIEPRSATDILINATIFFESKPEQINLEKETITLKCSTNVGGIGEIKYGLTENLELGSVKELIAKKDLEIKVSGLQPGELYFMKAFSVLGNDTTPAEIKAFTTISNSTGSIEIVFNDVPKLIALEQKSAYPNKTGNMADTIVSYINRAKKTLDIAIYDVANHSSKSDNTNEKIFDAVKAKVSSGVKVRIITDDTSSDPFFTELMSSANVMWGNSDGIMHHKFIVIDREEETSSWVVTGSVNWTYNNLVMDANNLVAIQDQSLAKAYTYEFNEMWGGSQEEPNYAKGVFGAQKKDNSPHQFLIGGIPIELYFSPSDQTESKIVKALQSADYQVDFAMMAFTSNLLGSTLVDAVHNGITVTGVIDYTEYTGSEQDVLIQAGANITAFANPNQSEWPEGTTIHHKFAVVDYGHPDSDPLVITGTHNWSASAESKNDENTLIIHSAQIADLYYQEYLSVLDLMATDGKVIIMMDKPGVIVSPNPFQESFNIQSQSTIQTLLIFDLSGKLILCKAGNGSNKIALNLGSLERGAYLLKVQDANQRISQQKIIKM